MCPHLRAYVLLRVNKLRLIRARFPASGSLATCLRRHKPPRHFSLFLSVLTHFPNLTSTHKPDAWTKRLKEPFVSPVACVSRGPRSQKGEAPEVADSLTRAHLLGDNLMDVVDSAFSIHNLSTGRAGRGDPLRQSADA